MSTETVGCTIGSHGGNVAKELAWNERGMSVAEHWTVLCWQFQYLSMDKEDPVQE